MSELLDEGSNLVYTPEIIASRTTELSNNKYLPDERQNEMQQFFVSPGDIIFPIVGSLGRGMLITDDMPKGIINQRLAKFYISSSELNQNYFLWLFARSEFYLPYIELYCRGSIIVNLTKAILHDLPVPIPPIDEQHRIADFLDAKCAEIDALSVDVQSEIETLEAYKRSKVFEAIAHGVDHDDFQETDSDVWRTIPANWKLVDIKYLFEIVKRIAGKEGYDILAITQQGLKVKDISSNEGQIASDYSGYQFVYPGDFAMNHMDLLTGWVDLSDKFGVTSPDYRVFRLRDAARFDRKFYKYVMQCCYMCRIFYSLGQGVSNLGRWRLQTSAFNNFKVPVPPYEEQIALGNYLDDIIGEIDDIIAQKREQLAVLADYKKSVIYEYVTGKKEAPAI